ncbi:hypothetical protein T4A_2998 [Trichinella pseudospiralis]|uniref:Uncharacterized protein n=1 Tax=Trichinella pseudospiralis TaxID=6337 RepID=A0A0V1E5X5_TRIPS|nr:hypothetical protein T4A_2998 [Trichinella pseudospiralis]
MQIFTSPQAMPQAMPQAEYQKFRIFQNIAPGFALRHCPRANKNLHMASGHASAPGVAPRLRHRPQALLQATPQGYNGLRQTISFWIPVSLFILVP